METTFFYDLDAVIGEIWPSLLNKYYALKIELAYYPQGENTYANFEIKVLTKDNQVVLSSSKFVNVKLLNQIIQKINIEDTVIINNLKKVEEALLDLEEPEAFQRWCAENDYDFNGRRTFFSREQPIYTINSYEERCVAGESLQDLRDDFHKQIVGEFIKTLLLDKSENDSSESVSICSKETYIKALFSALLDVKTIPIKYDANLIYSDIVNLKEQSKWIVFVFCAEKSCECQANSKDSFISAAISIVMEKWMDVEKYNLHYSNSSYIMDTAAMIHLTARDMTEGLLLPNYQLFQELSATLYEKKYAYGKIIFRDRSLNRGNNLFFRKEIEFKRENLRYIRKLLEMTSDETGNAYMLLANYGTKIKIYGLTADTACNDNHVIQFGGYMKWFLSKGNKELFSHDSGHYKYTVPGISSRHMPGLEHYYTQQEMKSLTRIVDSSIIQKHGALILIYSDSKVAESEVTRLVQFDRGIQLFEPIDLNCDPGVIVNLSSIDGAVAIDSSGMCYGMGIIVDGDARIAGTPARGARYNSAKNYLARLKDRKSIMPAENENTHRRPVCIALVISEDGSKEFLA